MDTALRDEINLKILENKDQITRDFILFNESNCNVDIELVNNNKVLASPVVISKEQHNLVECDLKRIIEILIQIPQLYFDGDYEKFFDKLGLSSFEKNILKDFTYIDPATFVARPDIAFDGNCFKVLEFNVSSAICGILTNEILGNRVYSKIFSNYVLLEGFNYCKANVIKSLGNIFKAKSENKKEITAAIIMHSEDQQDDVVYLSYMKELLESEGIMVYVCDPDELEYNNGLFFNGCKIDIAFRAFTLDMNSLNKNNSFRNIIKAAKNHECTLITSLSCKMFSSKVNLAFLSEISDSNLLDESDRQLLKNHIPWTRILENSNTLYREEKIDLIKFITTHKNNFIIKPFTGAGGNKVIIGKMVSQVEWENIIINNSIKHNYIVQEYIEPTIIKLPVIDYATEKMTINDYLTVFSALYIGNVIPGYYVRCQNIGNEVINANSGALATNAIIV